MTWSTYHLVDMGLFRGPVEAPVLLAQVPQQQILLHPVVAVVVVVVDDVAAV